MAVVQDLYGTSKLRILAIGIQQSVSTVKSYANGNSALFLVDASGAASAQYNINGTIPINYVVRPNGIVFHGLVGYNEAQIKSWIDSCLLGIEEGHSMIVKNPELLFSPNPFKTATTISIQGVNSTGNLQIQDLTGRTIKSFSLSPESKIIWDRKDNNNREVPVGIYFCKFNSNEINLTRKVVILK